MSRLNLETDAQFDQALHELTVTTGGTKADVIRNAVATYKFLKSQTVGSGERVGNKVSITDADGKIKNDVILP